MIIDCGTCAVAGAACSDCVVTVLLGIPDVPGIPEVPDTGVAPVTVVADEHAAAISVLAESGLVPPLRLVPRSQAS
jgi:hypothetical protein